MTELLDAQEEPRIGPLISGTISSEPQAWGPSPKPFVLADDLAQRFVDRELARMSRERELALELVQEEIQELLRALLADDRPRTVLHGLVTWGALSVPRLAGFLGASLDDVRERVRMLESVGVLVPSGTDNRSHAQYAIDPDAVMFKA